MEGESEKGGREGREREEHKLQDTLYRPEGQHGELPSYTSDCVLEPL